jgi:hypothetical protein
MKIPPMPKVQPQRLYEDDKPNGYLESFRDWAENNQDAVTWFLDNAEEINKILKGKK